MAAAAATIKLNNKPSYAIRKEKDPKNTNGVTDWFLETGLNKMEESSSFDTVITDDTSKMKRIGGMWFNFAVWFRQNLLLFVTFAGVSIGIFGGIWGRSLDLDDTTIHYIAYPGELFMRLLKLMILPLIIASLITGAASLNAKMNGMIALRTIVYFLMTSLISALIGLLLVLTIHPGTTNVKTELGHGTTEKRRVDVVDKFLDLGRNLVPDNIFQASFKTAYTDIVRIDQDGNSTELDSYEKDLIYRDGTNTLGIIFFCLTFGTVLGSMGNKAKIVVDFFQVIDEVILKMVNGIMWISPLGISSVICAKILSVSNLGAIMSKLALFILSVISGVLFHQFIVLQLIYFLIVRKNPFRFWWGLLQAWMTSFATASTAAALPITFRCMKENNNVDPRISKFVLPIGATVNMDGTALFVTTASIFIAQMNNIALDAGQLATVILTSTATSIAAASVPSAALVLMLIVLTSIGAPYQDVSLLWAIDWLLDRFRTTNNMLGDAYGAAVVEALSKDELQAMDAEKLLANKTTPSSFIPNHHKISSFVENGRTLSPMKEEKGEEMEDYTNITTIDSPYESLSGTGVETVPEIVYRLENESGSARK